MKKDWTYKDWYQRNKEMLSERRKAKYKKDKKRREKIREKARLYYQKFEKVKEPKDRRTVSSGKTEFVTIGKLSEMIGRDDHTIRTYHKAGILPSPDAFDNRGWRLYHPKVAKIIKKAFELFDDGKMQSLADVSTYIQKFIKEKVNKNGSKGKTGRGVRGGLSNSSRSEKNRSS